MKTLLFLLLSTVWLSAAQQPAPIYLLLDVAHPKYAECIALARAEFAKVLPNNNFSINLSKDGTQALVKVLLAAPQDKSVFLKVGPGLVVRDFTKTNHSEAIALVRAETWEAKIVEP